MHQNYVIYCYKLIVYLSKVKIKKYKFMKEKNLILLIVLGMMSMLFFNSCSGEDPYFSSPNSSVIKSTHQWSTATKGDTLIYECAQIVSLNYLGKVTTFNPKAKIVFYKSNDVITIDPSDNPKAIYKTSNETKDETSSSPTIYSYDKEFIFEDGQKITAKAFYEVYTFDEDKSINLPFVSINSIDFVDANTALSPDKTDEYKVDLLFSFDWKVNYGSEEGKKDVEIDYLKVALNSEKPDELIDITYNQSYEWTDDNSLVLIFEKNEIWSLSGKKSQKYQSPALEFNLSSAKNKTLECSSFDLKSEQKTTTVKSETISNDDWNIIKNEVTEIITISNSSLTFEDSFVYQTYKASFRIDGKEFEYDLSSVFSYDTSISKNNEQTSTHTTLGSLIVCNKTFNSAVVTTLNLKEKDEPAPDDDTIPAHGRILSHFVSAVFDVSSKVTKKCVIVRYEQGYDWGICEYDEYYPTSFTYTQSGYSGFNSAAIEKKGQYRLARAVDTSSAIYWYKENNELVSGIDVATCKAIGWKNMVNGQYCSKMNGYEEKFSSDSYTLTLTAPNGSTKTFKSKKAN